MLHKIINTKVHVESHGRVYWTSVFLLILSFVVIQAINVRLLFNFYILFALFFLGIWFSISYFISYVRGTFDNKNLFICLRDFTITVWLVHVIYSFITLSDKSYNDIFFGHMNFILPRIGCE